MKKGQGAFRRKTLLEAKYGAAATGDAGKHLNLLVQLDYAKMMLRTVKMFLFEDEPGVGPAHVEAKELEVAALEKRVVDSWEAVRRQPEALRKLVLVAEQNRDTADGQKSYIEGAVYGVEWAIVTMYNTGHRDYRNHQKLLAFAEEIKPDITESTFSRIVKRYGLALERNKPGPKPERRKTQ